MQPFHNRLLDLLDAPTRARLEPSLEPVTLTLHQAIEAPLEPIEAVYFPTDGIVSVVGGRGAASEIEVGVIGCEGMTGLALVLGSDRTPQRSMVQAEGSALRIATPAFLAAFEASPALRALALRYVQFFLTQAAQTAVTNGRAKVAERLARWLLMAQDRLGGDRLGLTHEFIAMMLGVRRAGVTTTIHGLEGRKLIRGGRGVIQVLDRPGLMAVAAGSYGVAEAEYRRLFGDGFGS